MVATNNDESDYTMAKAVNFSRPKGEKIAAQIAIRTSQTFHFKFKFIQFDEEIGWK